MSASAIQVGQDLWSQTVLSTATAESLQRLFAGEIAGICLRNFLTPRECRELTARIKEIEFTEYQNVSPPIERFGITVFEYDSLEKAEYFKAVKWADRNTARITDGIVNPLDRVVGWLTSLMPDVSIGRAFEDGYGYYFAGLLRRIEEGTLVHVDFAPAEHPHWSVARVVNQMAWNIYLSVPGAAPGYVSVWQKQWKKEDDVYKLPGSYGYDSKVIKGIPAAQIVPESGMLMMINSRNFHQVLPSSGMRLAMSAALGATADNKILLWS
ncbi:MAG TPA: hypothetical protein VHV32_11765 [Candidatus Angelobacter sp.]|nr:hypothetical protein [Candidatus Angelobacter sp.]